MPTPPTQLRHVVTAVVTAADGTLALVKRSPRVGSYRGHWGGLSGFVEAGDASTAARAATEAVEEAGLTFTSMRHTVAGRPFRVDDAFIVHPHAFVVAGKPELSLNWENDEAAWVARAGVGAPPCAPVVPRLTDSIARVSPSGELAAAAAAIMADRERGAAQLAVAALDALREEAERSVDNPTADAATALDAAANAAYTLASMRPAMWALAAALAAVLARARAANPPDAGAAWRAVAAAARDELGASTTNSSDLTERGVTAVAAAVAAAPSGARVVTHSYSSGVVAVLSRVATDALTHGRPPLPILVCESRPLNEGVRLARALADAGAAVVLATDAAGAALTARPGFAAALVVGADAVTPAAVVNKVGTASLARAAAEARVPCLCVAGGAKLGGGTLEAVALGRRPPVPVDDAGGEELVSAYGSSVDLDRVTVLNPYFEAAPLSLFDAAIGGGVVTEGGVLDAATVAKDAAAARARVAAAFGLDWVGHGDS